MLNGSAADYYEGGIQSFHWGEKKEREREREREKKEKRKIKKKKEKTSKI